MKTGEEYLKENEFITNKFGNYVYSNGPHSFDLPTILQDYASIYANAKLDEAAEKAKAQLVSNNESVWYSDAWAEVNKQSILDLKDQI